MSKNTQSQLPTYTDPFSPTASPSSFAFDPNSYKTNFKPHNYTPMDDSMMPKLNRDDEEEEKPKKSIATTSSITPSSSTSTSTSSSFDFTPTVESIDMPKPTAPDLKPIVPKLELPKTSKLGDTPLDLNGLYNNTWNWTLNNQLQTKDTIKDNFTYNDRKAYGLDRNGTSVMQHPDGTYTVIDNKGNEYKVTGNGADAEFEMTRDWRDMDGDGDVNVGETFLAPFRRIGKSIGEGINALKTFFNGAKATSDRWLDNTKESASMSFGGVDKFGQTKKGYNADLNNDGEITKGEKVGAFFRDIVTVDNAKQQKKLDNIASRLTTVGMNPEEAKQYVKDNAGACLILSSFGDMLTGGIFSGPAAAIKAVPDFIKTASHLAISDKYDEEIAHNVEQREEWERQMKALYPEYKSGLDNNSSSHTDEETIRAKEVLDEVMPDKVEKLTLDDPSARAQREVLKAKANNTYYTEKEELNRKPDMAKEEKTPYVPGLSKVEDEEDIKASDALLKNYVIRGMAGGTTKDPVERLIKHKLLAKL